MKLIITVSRSTWPSSLKAFCRFLLQIVRSGICCCRVVILSTLHAVNFLSTSWPFALAAVFSDASPKQVFCAFRSLAAGFRLCVLERMNWIKYDFVFQEMNWINSFVSRMSFGRNVRIKRCLKLKTHEPLHESGIVALELFTNGLIDWLNDWIMCKWHAPRAGNCTQKHR